VYGTGAGIFFVGYFFFEVPCNLALQKIGAKYWLGPIMIVWGMVSACTMLVRNQAEFYLVRFVLGLVESGFFPGVILYLTFWFTSKYRAKMVAAFMTAIPLSGVLGGPVSGWLLARMSSVGGLRGWQWLYLVEAIPSLLAGVIAMFFLSDNPAKAKWLNQEERELLLWRLEEDEAGKRSIGGHRKLVLRFRLVGAISSGRRGPRRRPIVEGAATKEDHQRRYEQDRPSGHTNADPTLTSPVSATLSGDRPP